MRLILAASALVLSLLACTPAPAPPPSSPPIDYAPVEHPIASAGTKCPKRADTFRMIGAPWAENTPKREIGGPVAVDLTAMALFCTKNSENPLCVPVSGGKLTLSEVNAVDSWLRGQFEYTDDLLMHQDDDFYDDNTVCGDCEDYALTLARYLAKRGQAGPAMWLAIWYPNWEGGHATLLVETSDHGIVEYTVGGTPGASVFDPDRQPVRLATIQMDGKLVIAAYDGVAVSRRLGQLILFKDDTRDDARRAGLLKD